MSETGNELVAVLTEVARVLGASTDELNLLDGFSGDGDLGITMGLASAAILEVLADPSAKTVPDLLSACGVALAKKAPSTSGTLLATGFLRAGPAVRGATGGDVDKVAAALDAALEGMKARGKAAVGDRTLVDALDAACRSLSRSRSEGLALAAAMALAADASRAATEATTTMEPRLGRSSWVPERARGHPDAGCRMVTIVLEAAAEALARAD